VSDVERRAYTKRVQEDEVVFSDETAIAFLSRFPTQLGYVLVASKGHREHVTGDYSEEEYVALQRVVHRVGEAVRRVTPTERVYVLSLGSQEGNRHVHWHVVALPPGVPYDEQQLAAVDWERAGVLQLGDEERAALGARIRAQLR
jgi:diadenosine tetraphosphate (Ap4A) HIT family hydrolase